MKAIALRCEYMQNPCGIDVASPLLSWSLTSDICSDEQTAYRIIVSNEEKTVWDSGKVTSKANSTKYNGISLQSNKHYCWKVCVWNKDDIQAEFSEMAYFDTGIFNNEWIAEWICKKESGTSLPVFKKSFAVDKKVRRAVAFISAPGMFELNINGTKTGDAFFEPGESCYDKKVFYSSYDVTHLLCMGNNTLLTYLGKGFYHNTPVNNRFNRVPKIWGELMLLCQLEIEFTDGIKTVIGTDKTWLCADGPLAESCWLGGEDYDARIEKQLADESVWQGTKVLTQLPFERIEARKYPPIKIIEEFKPVSVVRLDNGDYTVDFGTNFAGTYKFTATAKRKQKIYFYPAENVNDDGSVNQGSTLFGKDKIYDTYTFSGDSTEIYTPKFVYHGMRYLQISGIDITADMIYGYSLHCDNEIAGSIECSDNDINAIDKIINRSISDNMFHVITDCPHREKLGWLEVPHLLYNTIADNYDIAAYTRKTVADICDAQSANGSVPSIVPPFTTGIKEHALRYGPDTTPNDPIWCGAIVMLPFYSYKRYGDIDLLKNTYSAMHSYMEYLSTLSDKYLIHGSTLNRDLGDWVALDKTSVSFAVSCMYYQLAHTMAETSAVLNYRSKEAYYKALAENIKNAINIEFFDTAAENYDTGSQTANALPLFLGIVPCEHKSGVLENLIKNVKNNDYHITAGEYGMRPLLNVLSKNGYCDIVYRMLMNTTPPSYKHFIDLGKTSLPEMWNGEWSQNHCILGHGGGWLYEYLGGIRNDGIAFDKIVIEPYFLDDMEWLSVQLKTPKGTVSSAWKRKKDIITLTVEIPVNSAAKIILPSGNVNIKELEAVYVNNKMILQVTPGKYIMEFKVL